MDVNTSLGCKSDVSSRSVKLQFFSYCLSTEMYILTVQDCISTRIYAYVQFKVYEQPKRVCINTKIILVVQALFSSQANPTVDLMVICIS